MTKDIMLQWVKNNRHLIGKRRRRTRGPLTWLTEQLEERTLLSGQAPVLAPIADQTVNHNVNSISTVLSTTDAENDPITYTVEAFNATENYKLDLQFAFYVEPDFVPNNYYLNARGLQEKYILGGAGRTWYLLFQNGDVKRWDGSVANLTLVAKVDAATYDNPALLWNAQLGGPAAVPTILDGNNLTVDPPSSFAGTVLIRVTANDGTGTDTKSFFATFTNQPPVLPTLSNISLADTDPAVSIPLTATDADNDPVTVTVTNNLPNLVYNLDQQLGFYVEPDFVPNNYYLNARGLQEKYILGGNNRTWYLLFQNGDVKRWDGSLNNLTLIANLDRRVYNDPSLLWDAVNGTLDLAKVEYSGGVLKITPNVGASGSFQVTVTASDGVVSTVKTFQVTVIAPPTGGLGYTIQTLGQVATSTTTGEKPQSKVWNYNGRWWAVFSQTTGTYVWRLDGTTWTRLVQLTTATNAHADVKIVGDKAYVLMVLANASQNPTSTAVQFRALQFNPIGTSYNFLSTNNTLITVPDMAQVETATIDVDSTGRMWMAYEQGGSILVRYADAPYKVWSAPITLATGVNSDDIADVIAMPGKIAVVWSNQTTKRFGFRTHIDGTAPTVWTTDEVPASASAQNIGGGFADDHVHMAVKADGTLYVAAKTSYETGDTPKLILLVRRPNGVWDPAYSIQAPGETITRGTRPILVLNEQANTLLIAYRDSDSAGPMVFREILDNGATVLISPKSDLITGYGSITSAGINDISGPKANITNEVVFIAEGNGFLGGVKLTLSQESAPRAIADTYTVLQGGTIIANDANGTVGDASNNGVRANDLSQLGTPTAVLVSQPSHGSLTFAADGTFTYSHDGSSALIDTFSYRVLLGSMLGNTATVTINITPQTGGGTSGSKFFQQGVNGYTGAIDTHIIGGLSAAVNSGTAAVMSIDGSPDTASLLKWGGLSGFPAGAIVDSAKIVLNVTDASPFTYSVYGLLKPFVETEATYEKASNTVDWEIDGSLGTTDRTALIGTISATVAGTTTIDLDATGVALVQQWLADPSTNHGVIIMDYANSKNDRMDFSSREAADTNVRPKLIINFHVDPLLASGTPTTAVTSANVLTAASLSSVVDAAKSKILSLAPSALKSKIAALLDNVQFAIGDLSGRRLGVAAGNVVTLDADAAGFGWFIDATPGGNSEFSGSGLELTAKASAAKKRIDLLTAVVHELGHTLGAEHSDSQDVMNGDLAAGTRRLIDVDSFFDEFAVTG